MMDIAGVKLRQSFYASNHLFPVNKNISTKYKVDGAPMLEAWVTR